MTNSTSRLASVISLEVVDVMNPDGTLNALAGEEFNGMDRFEARKKAVEKLT